MLCNKDKNFCFVYLAASKSILLFNINFKWQFCKMAKFLLSLGFFGDSEMYSLKLIGNNLRGGTLLH